MNIVDRLNVERAFLGSLLLMPARSAGRFAGLVEADDLEDPRLRVVHALAAELAAEGVAPDPVAVLARARTRATVTTAHAIREFAELLHTLYAECPLPVCVPYYIAATLDDALRRRCAVLGERIDQAAASSTLADLIRLVGEQVHAVLVLVDRRARTLESLGLTVDEARS
ncbi:MAG: hypothetical protein M3513_08820 [Actinomycetota bacterium]|nr:hypothetical protein [Actinomycetota bacterium]